MTDSPTSNKAPGQKAAPAVIPKNAIVEESSRPTVEPPAAPVPPVTPPPVAPPVAPPAAVVKETRVVSQNFTFEETVERLKKEGTENQKALISATELYMQRIPPNRPVLPDEGAAAQYAFWRAIRTVTHDVPNAEFKALWVLLLHYFERYKAGVFSDHHIYRFNEAWSRSTDELRAYNSLLNLIKLTCDSRARQTGLKQINLDRALSVGFSDTARQRLLKFYQQ